MPLQDLPCLSLQGSMLSQSKRTNKRKSKGCLGEGLDTECTPVELIQQWSPPCKHQWLISKGKENENNQFILGRRSRRKKESTSGKERLSDRFWGVLFVAMITLLSLSTGISWDHLPDELLLRIFFYFPLHDLLRMSIVCKRWHRLAWVSKH